MNSTKEDEWEYEYADEEVEDFYITLDLSNAAPKPTNNHAASDSQLPIRYPGGRRKTVPGRSSRPQGGKEDRPDGDTNRNDQENLESRRIQILDLHTTKPLINYDGWLLSCKWASTIGTDMLFTKPSSSEEAHSEPLRSLSSIDLLGISSAKLMASTARLQPRERRPRAVNQGDLVDTMDVSENAPESFTAVNRSGRTPEGQANHAQFDFLEKLQAVKARRGETDTVPFTMIRPAPSLIPQGSQALQGQTPIDQLSGGSDERINQEPVPGDPREAGHGAELFPSRNQEDNTRELNTPQDMVVPDSTHLEGSTREDFGNDSQYSDVVMSEPTVPGSH